MPGPGVPRCCVLLFERGAHVSPTRKFDACGGGGRCKFGALLAHLRSALCGSALEVPHLRETMPDRAMAVALGVGVAIAVAVRAARGRSTRAAAPASSRSRLRAHVWMDMPSGPQLTALCEAVDSDAVQLTVGATSCPADTEVYVLDPNLLPDDLQGLASLRALRALILPYAGLAPKHLDPLRAAFGERLGTTVQLHNSHHNATCTAEMAVALLLAAVRPTLSPSRSHAPHPTSSRTFALPCGARAGQAARASGPPPTRGRLAAARLPVPGPPRGADGNGRPG